MFNFFKYVFQNRIIIIIEVILNHTDIKIQIKNILTVNCLKLSS